MRRFELVHSALCGLLSRDQTRDPEYRSATKGDRLRSDSAQVVEIGEDHVSQWTVANLDCRSLS
jgi:hypothetical protein